MQKNTSGQKWRVFAFDRTTNAPVTGDAANISAKISKDFAAVVATNDVNPTEIENGYYAFDLTQAETNANDLLILPESTTANVVVLGCPARIATTPASFADDVIQTGDSFARIGNNGAALTEAGGTGDQFTAIPWNAAWDAEVQSEVDDGLVARGLDHLVSASVAGTDITDDSIIAKMVSKSATADWDTYDNTTDSAEAIRDRGDAAWITATGFSTHSAADVWAVGTRTITGGTITTYTGNTPQTGDSYARLGAPSGASIAADIATKLPTASYTAPPSAVDIATQVDTTLSGTHGAGSWATATGFSTLDAAGVRSAVGLAAANLDTQLADLPTVAEFEARTLLAASYGTSGNQTTIISYLDTEIAAILAAVDTEVAAIKAKTDQLTFTVANQVDSNALSGGGGLDAAGVRAAIGLASANLDTQLADLPTAAEVATQVAAIDIDGRSLQSAVRIVSAVVAGEVSGAGTNTEVFVGLDGATTRATVTVDASGNRSAVAYV